jgi:hypothetical protein
MREREHLLAWRASAACPFDTFLLISCVMRFLLHRNGFVCVLHVLLVHGDSIVRLVLRSANCFVRIDIDAFLAKAGNNARATPQLTERIHARAGSRFVAVNTVFLPFLI